MQFAENNEAAAATVEHLRQAAAQRVDSLSLRGVAREIGMSRTGLKKFLLGTAPYSPTLRRLRKWYLRYAELPTGSLGCEEAFSAIAVLSAEVKGSARNDFARKVLDALGDAYDVNGQACPSWLPKLRTALGL